MSSDFVRDMDMDIVSNSDGGIVDCVGMEVGCFVACCGVGGSVGHRVGSLVGMPKTGVVVGSVVGCSVVFATGTWVGSTTRLGSTVGSVVG